MLIDIKLKKKIDSGIRSQWPFEKYTSTHAFKSISPKWPVYLAEILYEVPSQQKIWDQQGPHMEFYMGPIWAPHMGLGWDLQHSSMWYPHGQTHMGHNMGTIWVLFWIWPRRPMPANLCRINF